MGGKPGTSTCLVHEEQSDLPKASYVQRLTRAGSPPKLPCPIHSLSSSEWLGYDNTHQARSQGAKRSKVEWESAVVLSFGALKHQIILSGLTIP